MTGSDRANNMTQPRIAITMRVVQAEGYNEPRDAISHDWIAWLGQAGLTPIPLSNKIQDAAVWLRDLAINAVILSNGNDVSAFAGEEFSSKSVDIGRDAFERKLLQHCIERNVPVLGVCRGMQFINAFYGGGIERDVKSRAGMSHAGTLHDMEITHPVLQGWAGARRVSVNSFHNHGVLQNMLAEELTTLAAAGDVVEALIHRTDPVLGIQWHPERTGGCETLDKAIVQSMLNGYRELR